MISVSELSGLFGIFPDQTCWRVGKYLGSMLVLDFGEKILVGASPGIEEGSLKLGIRNVNWRAVIDDKIICDAETISPGNFERNYGSFMIGAAIIRVSEIRDRWLRFEFDNNLNLDVDSRNSWGSDGDLLEIVFPNGQYVVLTEKGEIEVLTEVEPIRFGKNKCDQWGQRH